MTITISNGSPRSLPAVITFLLTSLSDGTITLWDTNNWTEIKAIKLNTLPANELVFSPNGDKIAVFTDYDSDGVLVFDMSTGTTNLASPINDYDERYLGMGFSPDSRKLFIVHFYLIKSWEVYQGRKLAEEKLAWVDNNDYIRYVSFSKNGGLLAIATFTGKMFLIDTVNWQKVKDCSKITGRIMNLSPDGETIATCSNEMTTLWNVNSEDKLLEVSDNCNQGAINFSWDSKYITILSDDARIDSQNPTNSLSIFEVKSGQKIITLAKEPGYIYKVAFSPDNKLLAVSYSSGKLSLWDIQMVNELCTLAQNSSTFGLSFSPDGRYIVSGSGYTISVWEWRHRLFTRSRTNLELNCSHRPFSERCVYIFRGAIWCLAHRFYSQARQN